MRRLVVGTAGHIDHGKSALVRALTGMEPDRLKEEQARGITIDLGFAHAVVDGVRLAFVDVPGHERFVRNMLAGATGIDAVLFVVAADESVMPQTREHLAICRLLEIESGVIALTKCDVADADLRAVAREETRALVTGTFLEHAPLIDVSSVTGEGLDTLRHALVSLSASGGRRPGDGPVRLPIDRVFTLRGFGTIVTGTLVSGTIRANEPLTLLPRGETPRVRGLHVHGRAVTEAGAGERVAVNLGDLQVQDIARGDTLVTTGAFEATRRIDVRLELLADAPPLRHATRVRFHQGTSEVMGRIALAPETTSGVISDAASSQHTTSGVVSGAASAQKTTSGVVSGSTPASETTPDVVWESGEWRETTPDVVFGAGRRRETTPDVVSRAVLAPGRRAYARLRLEADVVVTRGDRFVLRSYSPMTTIGGGLVLDPLPRRTGLRTAASRARFVQLDPVSAATREDAAGRACLALVADEGASGLAWSRLQARLGLAPSALTSLVDAAVSAGTLVRAGDRVLTGDAYQTARRALVALVHARHDAAGDAEGVPREEVRDRLHLEPRLFDALVDDLVRAGALVGRDRLALPGREAAASAADSAALALVETTVRGRGLEAIDAAELTKRTALSAPAIDRAVALLVRQKRVVRLEGLAFHRDALETLIADVRSQKRASGETRVDVAAFKARYGLSRKFAIPLLEFLDRERVTRRVGDVRIVL